jgi:transcriptional regulator with XRE-family HTH domain
MMPYSVGGIIPLAPYIAFQDIKTAFYFSVMFTLAELVGVNPRTVQKIEAGKLNILVTTLARIQAGLGCEWGELMGASKNPRQRRK